VPDTDWSRRDAGRGDWYSGLARSLLALQQLCLQLAVNTPIGCCTSLRAFSHEPPCS